MPNNRLAIILLQIGLAILYFYAAINSFLQPDIWVGYLPPFVGKIMDFKLALHIFSVTELILGIWLLSGKKLFWASLASGFMIFGIIVFNIRDLTILFRDLSLIFASFALSSLTYNTPKK